MVAGAGSSRVMFTVEYCNSIGCPLGVAGIEMMLPARSTVSYDDENSILTCTAELKEGDRFTSSSGGSSGYSSPILGVPVLQSSPLDAGIQMMLPVMSTVSYEDEDSMLTCTAELMEGDRFTSSSGGSSGYSSPQPTLQSSPANSPTSSHSESEYSQASSHRWEEVKRSRNA